jgi:hypothetical protein
MKLFCEIKNFHKNDREISRYSAYNLSKRLKFYKIFVKWHSISWKLLFMCCSSLLAYNLKGKATKKQKIAY